MELPVAVKVYEVGLRDGLQAEDVFIATEKKIELINDLSRTGVKRIQATSFVRPDWIPQLTDGEDVMQGILRQSGVEYNVLIPNRRGLERAVAARADSVSLVVSASSTHNRMNLNREREETLDEIRLVVKEAESARIPVDVGIATAFGCPYEGPTAQEVVVLLVGSLVDLGLVEISLGDTTGMANPVEVHRLVNVLRETYTETRFILHFHDTRGMGLANVLAGLQCGINIFDSSIGGIGGCPYAPGATGNIATEDLVHMLGEMRIDTGIDLDSLIACTRKVSDLLGHDLPSHVLQAGKASELVEDSGADLLRHDWQKANGGRE
jgi:hydroxymethylglutaryl-CoA lyase